MSFDLSQLAKKETVELHLRHPITDELLYEDGEKKKKPMIIVLYTSGTQQYRNAFFAMQNARMNLGKDKKLSAEELYNESTELLVACSVEGVNIDYKGKPLNNAETFRELYSDPSLDWIRAAADRKIVDTADFLGK